MNRSLFLSIIVCLPIMAVAFLAGSVLAQGNGPFQYRLEYGFFPVGATSVAVYEIAEVSDGTVTGMIAVGSCFANDWPRHGYVYDHLTGSFTDIHSLFGLDNYWSSTCDAINASGIVVGSIDDGVTRRAFWFDNFAASPTLQYVDAVLPQLSDLDLRPRAINSPGDILIQNISGGSGYIANPGYGVPGTIELIALPLEMALNERGLNDSRIVVSAHSSIADTTVRFDAGTGDVTTFTDFSYPQDINNFGEFCATAVVTIPINKRRNQIEKYACRHDGNQVNWLSDPIQVGSAGARSINDDGDVAFRTTDYSTDIGWFYHASLDQSFELRTLVSDSFFNDASHVELFISDRNQSLAVPTPVISGMAIGSSGERRLFFLFPESTTLTPGVSVAPSSGLTTTEAGGTDSIDISLNTEPTTDVTIGISSSDPTEGVPSVTSLTFTSANWQIPQSVIITGQDDAIEDGDMAYTIITAAATSADPDYNGLNPDDVSVTNQDDEQAPTVTYDSVGTQNDVDIPDQGSATSTITVPDLYQVADVNVTLTIDHDRVQDLDVFLIGPDGTRIQLFTDVGGNGVNFSGTTLDDEAGMSITAGSAPFSGSFYPEGNLGAFDGKDTDDNWTLEVTDDKRNQTGMIRNWSITFEIN